ncbi:MAG: CRISPR-associated endonuclease Cas1, partial [Desulfobacterales bacterium]|nr:CRISPR-associated endonuclease Cas1 [Desulfobacterales bacterium]
AVAAVLRREIPVVWLGGSGQFLGGYMPATPAHGFARITQYQRTLDPAFVLRTAGRVVAAKIYNQRRILQRLLANRASDSDPDTAGAATLTWMESLLATVGKAADVAELMGFEGTAAARYFQQWGTFLPEAFPFERRSTRPPHNAVNACISFGATLLYHEMVAACHAHGLDPALGCLHTTENGRWSLALDLMEPFRPCLVEALALDCFSHQILNEDHFEPQNGGIYLNNTGRRKYLLQYERRMERQFLSEHTGNRTCLRQQVDQQAVLFKASLETPDRFEPFLMN